MFDNSQRLRENPNLLFLLSHYAQLGAEDRATWQDRLMHLDGVEPRQLSALHGELIAFDWIEQNTGQAISHKVGTVSACYRITLQGLRAFRRFHEGDVEEELLEAPEKPQPKFLRKKKAKVEDLVVVGSE